MILMTDDGIYCLTRLLDYFLDIHAELVRNIQKHL